MRLFISFFSIFGAQLETFENRKIVQYDENLKLYQIKSKLNFNGHTLTLTPSTSSLSQLFLFISLLFSFSFPLFQEPVAIFSCGYVTSYLHPGIFAFVLTFMLFFFCFSDSFIFRLFLFRLYVYAHFLFVFFPNSKTVLRTNKNDFFRFLCFCLNIHRSQPYKKYKHLHSVTQHALVSTLDALQYKFHLTSGENSDLLPYIFDQSIKNQ